MAYTNATNSGSAEASRASSEEIWRSMNMPKVSHSPSYQHDWVVDKPYHWTEDAACSNYPITMFVIANAGSPIAEGLTAEELNDLNNTNFNAAVEVCEFCPVKDACLSSASSEDLKETVRGGKLPSRHSPRYGGGSKPGTRVKNDPTKPCKKGHDLKEWHLRTDGNGAWYCRGCKRELRGSQPRVEIDPTKPCKDGHFEWRKDRKGTWRCMPCKRAKEREGYARRKSEPVAKLDA